MRDDEAQRDGLLAIRGVLREIYEGGEIAADMAPISVGNVSDQNLMLALESSTRGKSGVAGDRRRGDARQLAGCRGPAWSTTR